MGRLSDRIRRRRFRGKVVLWGGRRYDIQVGSQRDLRRCETFRLFGARYDGFRVLVNANVITVGGKFEPNPETLRQMWNAVTR